MDREQRRKSRSTLLLAEKSKEAGMVDGVLNIIGGSLRSTLLFILPTLVLEIASTSMIRSGTPYLGIVPLLTNCPMKSLISPSATDPFRSSLTMTNATGRSPHF